MGTTAIASSPALYARLPYDVLRDLTPLSLVVRMPNVLLVHPSLPVRTVKELVALAKARPGTLNSASAGAGSSWNALFAPAATPRDIVLKIHGALAESLGVRKVRETLLGVGAEPVGSPPEELAVFLRDEMEKWGKIVRAAGVKVQ